MALGPVHCGSFLLFSAFVLLLIATLSAPIINRVSFLDVTGLRTRSTFGTFGYCFDVNEAGGVCSRRQLGYNIVAASEALFDHEWTSDTVQHLTKALVLHPIACGLTFLSLLVSIFSDRLGFIFSALLALLAFLVTLAALVIDFVMFGIIKREVDNNSNVRNASYANAIWMVLAATIVLFFAMFIVLFSCCTARRHKRSRDADAYGRGGAYDAGGYVGNGAPPMSYAPRKKHFWQRSQKY